MTTITTTTTEVQTPGDNAGFDEAQLAAAAFLARYSGRTLDAYRHDLRGFFQWAADHDITVLAATRPHIELWRTAMEQQGLAASTIDRRLFTVCAFYRYAHIDGRITSNPAEYVRRPKVHPTEGRGLDRTELGMFLSAAEHNDHAHQALAVLLGLNGDQEGSRPGREATDLRRHLPTARPQRRAMWSGPGRADGDDSAIQRDRLNPDSRLFGQATARTQHRAYDHPSTRARLTEGMPISDGRSASGDHEVVGAPVSRRRAVSLDSR